MNACDVLRLPDRYRREVYRQLVEEGRRMGEKSVSYSRWLRLVKRACQLIRSDPGGDIQL